MPEASEYLDLSQLANFAEALPDDEPIETEDFREDGLMPVGKYISASRDIQGKQRVDKHLLFTLTFGEGVQHVDAPDKTYATRFPLKHWISTKPFGYDDRPGMTSQVAEYLKLFGFEVKGMDTDDIIAAMQETQASPIGVRVGYEDRAIKGTDGSYVSRNLKTKDFNLGTKDAPQYVSTITIDGEVVYARPRVTGFFAL